MHSILFFNSAREMHSRISIIFHFRRRSTGTLLYKWKARTRNCSGVFRCPETKLDIGGFLVELLLPGGTASLATDEFCGELLSMTFYVTCRQSWYRVVTVNWMNALSRWK